MLVLFDLHDVGREVGIDEFLEELTGRWNLIMFNESKRKNLICNLVIPLFVNTNCRKLVLAFVA